ncbi:DUF4202 family protein [uncultured Cohaesibacter sp.]|uniref:DUF4202 family protein n=1 Tax=uncultured Cohaesibacter sp. TaxID=1002546 RepID=UPI002AAAA6A1|nr:DUF4202 family protein [uncultured Cohaesibacter sp.]
MTPLEKTSLEDIFEIIDQTNAQDPRMTAPQGTAAVPAELLRGFRLSLVCEEFAPSADDLVKIAARAQTLESWQFEEADGTPPQESVAVIEARKREHSAKRISQIMAANGYNEHDCGIVRDLVLGKSEDETGRAQLLEDLNGLVFIQFHAVDLLKLYPAEQLAPILTDCLSGMSDEALYHAIDQMNDPVLIETLQSIRQDLSVEKKSIVYLD